MRNTLISILCEFQTVYVFSTFLSLLKKPHMLMLIILKKYIYVLKQHFQ